MVRSGGLGKSAHRSSRGRRGVAGTFRDKSLGAEADAKETAGEWPWSGRYASRRRPTTRRVKGADPRLTRSGKPTYLDRDIFP